MSSLTKEEKHVPGMPMRRPDKIETFAGKFTARVTKVFINEDGSQYRATRRINRDGTITDKIEHRHD